MLLNANKQHLLIWLLPVLQTVAEIKETVSQIKEWLKTGSFWLTKFQTNQMFAPNWRSKRDHKCPRSKVEKGFQRFFFVFPLQQFPTDMKIFRSVSSIMTPSICSLFWQLELKMFFSRFWNWKNVKNDATRSTQGPLKNFFSCQKLDYEELFIFQQKDQADNINFLWIRQWQLWKH